MKMKIKAAEYFDESHAFIRVYYEGDEDEIVPSDWKHKKARKVLEWVSVGNTIIPFDYSPTRINEQKEKAKDTINKGLIESVQNIEVMFNGHSFLMNHNNRALIMINLCSDWPIVLNLKFLDGKYRKVSANQQKGGCQSYTRKCVMFNEKYEQDIEKIDKAYTVSEIQRVLHESVFRKYF